MDDFQQISQDLERTFERLEAQIDECRQTQVANFEQLTAHPLISVEQRTQTVSEELNAQRFKLLARLNECLSRISLFDFIDLGDVVAEPIDSDILGLRIRNLFIEQIGQVNLTEPRASVESIKNNLLTNLVYANPFDTEKKIEYLHLFRPQSSLYIGNLTDQSIDGPCNAIVMMVSRENAFCYNFLQDKLSIVRVNRSRDKEKEVRVLVQRNGLAKRDYRNFKVYGDRILATGIHGRSDVFIDIYDFNLKLRAAKKFDILTRFHDPIFKIERVSPDAFMHRYTTEQNEVYTLFDFKLNKKLEHQTPRQTFYSEIPANMRTKFEPFFYDGQSVQKLTARHLYLLAQSAEDQIECKKRIMRIHTGQDIKPEQLQEANRIDNRYFNYQEPPRQFLLFNLDRDTVNFFNLLEDGNVKGDFDKFNWVMTDERYRGGLTQNQDLFFFGDNSTMLIL